jgi:hypothetical protein
MGVQLLVVNSPSFVIQHSCGCGLKFLLIYTIIPIDLPKIYLF